MSPDAWRMGGKLLGGRSRISRVGPIPSLALSGQEKTSCLHSSTALQRELFSMTGERCVVLVTLCSWFPGVPSQGPQHYML